ncbi:MAG: class I SAM-dependent methyltransferase [Actinobacteria bacterium]|nr:class I SAM-dependent methyltransferase [Actinomycetota bacterium]
MNDYHLDFCASDEWADALKQWIVPSALAGVDLGDDVLEVGPGPGRTTDLLREMAPRLTAVEVDASLAGALTTRMAGSNVEVVHADATDMPFDDGRFSAAVSFIMLHHVPTADEQDALFAEVARVLRPGAVFAGVDSLDTPEFRDMHVDDVCNPIPIDGFESRLRAAGFSEATATQNEFVMEFRARR